MTSRPDFDPAADDGTDMDLTKRVQAGLAAAAAGRGLDPDRRQAILADARAAFETLLERHDGLAQVAVQRAYRHLESAGHDRADALAAARGGLAHGLCRFDPCRGYRVATYVPWWCRQQIGQLLRTGQVPDPAGSWWPLYHPDRPADTDPARPPARRAGARQVRASRSLDAAPAGRPGGRADGRTLGDRLADPDAVAADDIVGYLTVETVLQARDHLPDDAWLRHPAVVAQLVR